MQLGRPSLSESLVGDLVRDLRIAHVADTHLGYRASAVSGRDEDFARSWAFACRAIVDSAPDLIIHAGDIFHHPNPSWGAVGSFLAGCYILREANVPILMISGNHDSSRLTQRHTAFSVLSDILPDITIANADNPILIPVDNLETDIVLLPHRALLNPYLSRSLLGITTDLDKARYSILVAHGDIASGTRGENNELGSIAIPELVFDYPWSYIALGHLHAAQPFTQNGWYSGSIERCGWSDYPANPAWTTVSLSKTRSVRHSQQALPHRIMKQLQVINCEDISDFDICEQVSYLIRGHQIPDEPAIVRVILEELSSRRARNLEKVIAEYVRKLHPKFVIQVATKKSIQAKPTPTRESRYERMGSVLEMYKDFASKRVYPNPETAAFVQEQGLLYLRKAGEDIVDLNTGDERSVPLN